MTATSYGSFSTARGPRTRTSATIGSASKDSTARKRTAQARFRPRGPIYSTKILVYLTTVSSPSLRLKWRPWTPHKESFSRSCTRPLRMRECLGKTSPGLRRASSLATSRQTMPSSKGGMSMCGRTPVPVPLLLFLAIG